MKKEFTASMDHLDKMLAFVLDYAKQAGFEGDSLGQIELATEEALVNIIKHAYKGGKVGLIGITCSSPDKSLQIILQDNGPPFDPVAQIKGFDPEALIKSGAEGGFGIFLMTKMMDEVSYNRFEDSNILTLLKKLF